MALLTTYTVTRLGVTPTFVAAAGGGDTFNAGSYTVVYVKNGGGSPINVTITGDPSQHPLSNVTYATAAVSVTNGSEKILGPYPAAYFGDSSTQVGAITYSAVTSVTVAVIAVQVP